jgi:hypothetical protein
MTKTTGTARVEELQDLQQARDGSFYTILGVGGDQSEWTAGYEGWMAEAEIGKPVRWYVTSGAAVNAQRCREIGFVRESDCFPDDLTILLFPLDGLEIGRLAIMKLRLGDRWFDDVLDNMDGE